MSQVTAIIMAAGKGTRLAPFTDTRPKPLIPIANKPILEWNLEALQGLVEKAIIVIGYKGDMIKEQLGNQVGSIAVTYVEQVEQQGTGHALLTCKDQVTGKLLLMNGDDIFAKQDIQQLLTHERGVLGAELEDVTKFGVLEVMNNKLLKIHERSPNPPGKLVNIGCYVTDDSIFSIQPVKSPRGEIEIVQLVNDHVLQGKDYAVEPVQGYWLPVGYPWHILEANQAMLESIKGDNQGVVEPGATLKGEVVVGKGTVIKAGSYIEGPVVIGENCSIGPNCYIRPSTAIGNNCKVGNAVEVKNSVLFDKVSVGHLSYFGDSVIGEGTNIGAGTITANLRHDNKNNFVLIKGELVDSTRRKLGAIIGPGVHTGINTSIYPGRIIPTNSSTTPAEVVK